MARFKEIITEENIVLNSSSLQANSRFSKEQATENSNILHSLIEEESEDHFKAHMNGDQ